MNDKMEKRFTIIVNWHSPVSRTILSGLTWQEVINYQVGLQANGGEMLAAIVSLVVTPTIPTENRTATVLSIDFPIENRTATVLSIDFPIENTAEELAAA